MPTSTILSDNGVVSGTTGLKTAGGDDGTLILQTTTAGGTATTALTISNTQVTTLANALPAGSGGTGANTLTSENVIIGNGTSAVKFVAPGTTGNVLTSNGSAWLSQAAAAGGGDYIMLAYTSPATWTKPAGLKAVKVTVVGGGGASANISAPLGPGFVVTGGGGGGTSFKYLDAPAIPGPVSVTVGSGGTGTPTSPGAGNPGGTSSFGPLTSATGGTGGGSPAGSVAGGTGSNSTYSVPGGSGGVLSGSCLIFGRVGGGSTLGQGVVQSAISLTSPVYGVGGASWINNGQGTGSSGSAGIVIVEEFY
jgi:hypothetical protein